MPQFGQALRAEWPLEPDSTYLNHGTVGVTPRRVLAAQDAIRDDIERQPSRYLLRELTSVVVGGPRTERPRMREAAEVVAALLGARGDDVVFVDNATTGVNAVFYVPRSIRAFFRRQLLQRKNQFLGWDEVGGKRVMSFNEIPVRRTDALNVNETQVV